MNKIAIILHMMAGLTTAARARIGGTWDRLRREDDGQAVTEYTLVILVAASVALLLLNWVQGGALTTFFNDIFNQVTGMFSGGGA
jgi:Flp pilus assembly pilin Flp